jgi:hypothetical protein
VASLWHVQPRCKPWHERSGGQRSKATPWVKLDAVGCARHGRDERRLLRSKRKSGRLAGSARERACRMWEDLRAIMSHAGWWQMSEAPDKCQVEPRIRNAPTITLTMSAGFASA